MKRRKDEDVVPVETLSEREEERKLEEAERRTVRIEALVRSLQARSLAPRTATVEPGDAE